MAQHTLVVCKRKVTLHGLFNAIEFIHSASNQVSSYSVPEPVSEAGHTTVSRHQAAFKDIGTLAFLAGQKGELIRTSCSRHSHSQPGLDTVRESQAKLSLSLAALKGKRLRPGEFKTPA